MAGIISNTPGLWTRGVVTTGGDVEREAKSRLYNAVEGIGMYLFVLAVLWPYCFFFGKIQDSALVRDTYSIPLTLGALYLLFVSPFVHKDTLESWGLGNPFRLWKLLHEASLPKRISVVVAIAGLMIALNITNVIMWPEVAKFIGLRDTVFMEYNDPAKHPLGLFLVVPFGLVVSTFLVTCVIRYDNFGSAFTTALKISAPLMVMTFVGALAARGPVAFQTFDIKMYVLGVVGYVFWGTVQQLLFSSYFGTRMRKAFGPSTSPDNVIPKERRWLVALSIGGAISAVLVPLAYGTMVYLYGMEKAPFSLNIFLLGATLPFGTAWGYFYALDKKRMLVATLCGSFFGLIHLTSYGLVGVTFLLGVMLVYAFMEAKNRNLVALGFVHGLLGSTFGWLFGKDDAGAVHVDYSVGPLHIHNPAYVDLIFPMICIAGYVFLLAWCINNIQDDGAVVEPLQADGFSGDPAFVGDSAE